MVIAGEEGNEFRVDDGAFWHINMDLYYGYVPGEIVEVVHEPNKYWLATIEYCFKHLILLKWIGNYGEYWVDTSMPNSITGTNNAFSELNSHPKRLFPLGYHLQSQLKSQFSLEKPTKFLVKPSLYNPSKDPYASVKTVDDLLAHEVEQTNDTFHINHSNNDNNEPASLVLAKCKTKIDYKQEDEDELETALMNLNAIDNDDLGKSFESPDIVSDQKSNQEVKCDVKDEKNANIEVGTSEKYGLTSDSNQTNLDKDTADESSSDADDSLVDVSSDEICLEMCKDLQEIAISRGYYFGIDPASMNYSDEVFFTKPKQFFDTGGANHERVFVPGTLLEVAWTKCAKDNSTSIQELYWFAYVVKNIGGRLTLRWFLCDEPKFKQGRLEMKSCRSRFIEEEESEGDSNDNKSITEEHDVNNKLARLTSKDMTFSLHFCDQRIHTIAHGKFLEIPDNSDPYMLPENILATLKEAIDEEALAIIRQTHLDNVFDIRRMNLDKDRPLIDHILSTVHSKSPNYLDLIFGPKDSNCNRRVLVSNSRMTKLMSGCIERETRPGFFEVKFDDDAGEDGDDRFIYPLDNSSTILPFNWADNNQDCLSMDTSGNTTLASTQDSSTTGQHGDQDITDKVVTVEDTQDTDKQTKSGSAIAANETSTNESNQQESELCLKRFRSQLPRAGCSFTRLTNSEKSEFLELKDDPNFDEFDPSCWSRVLRTRELNAPKFHCCLDTSMKSFVESRFKVMDQLEVVHPLSDTTICLGRIRKVVFPLIWIQISADCYTLLPFDSTNIYPTRWCETHGHTLVSLLPPRKRCLNQTTLQLNNSNKKKKKKPTKVPIENSDAKLDNSEPMQVEGQIYEKEHFDLQTIKSRQEDLDYMLNEKSKYVKIYFNHKCFTGPSLSKSKICSLPQYVGPGPLRLVLEEVVTKVISVAYVPPRILNDLSSATFAKLLLDKNLTNVQSIEFKAKYQKRVYREDIPICVSADDVALYCECICEYIKCCYNLFGPGSYDGDDCPGHCRALTKSNKFMKRATYYRDKARAGEYLASTSSNTNSNNNNSSSNSNNNNSHNNDNQSSEVVGKKSASANGQNGNLLKTTSRARYAGRGSSESTSSSLSRSEQITSRASSAGDDNATNTNGLDLVEEASNVENVDNDLDQQGDNGRDTRENVIEEEAIMEEVEEDEDEEDVPGATEVAFTRDERDQEFDKVFRPKDQERNIPLTIKIGKTRTKSGFRWSIDSEFSRIDAQDVHPEEWSIDDVAQTLECCSLGQFKLLLESEAVDGQALLLLDRVALKEHLQRHTLKSNFSKEEVGKLCRFIEYVKAWATGTLDTVQNLQA